MDFSLKEIVKEYKDSRNVCTAEDAKFYLIARAATRGQVSDLLEADDIVVKDVIDIKTSLDNDKKPYEKLMFRDNGVTVYPDEWRAEQAQLKRGA